jgi:hypothetical protein
MYLEESHFSDWDEPGKVRVRALCGLYIARSDRAERPTCLVCRQALEARDRRDEQDGKWWEQKDER